MSDKEKEKEILEEVLEDLEESQNNREETEADVSDETEVTAAQEPETEDSDEETEAFQKESKGFRKKKKTDKKQEALEEKVNELEDKVKRQMAEFENFRKRTEKEKSTMFEMGAKSVVEKILPVVDNFERGLATVPEEEKDSPFTEGMNMIYKQLMSELESIGVKPIEAVGKEFNPDFHNAVMQVESDEYEEGIIAQELQKGYMYRESVVRHSMVAVTQ